MLFEACEESALRGADAVVRCFHLSFWDKPPKRDAAGASSHAPAFGTRVCTTARSALVQCYARQVVKGGRAEQLPGARSLP